MPTHPPPPTPSLGSDSFAPFPIPPFPRQKRDHGDIRAWSEAAQAQHPIICTWCRFLLKILHRACLMQIHIDLKETTFKSFAVWKRSSELCSRAVEIVAIFRFWKHSWFLNFLTKFEFLKLFGSFGGFAFRRWKKKNKRKGKKRSSVEPHLVTTANQCYL